MANLKHLIFLSYRGTDAMWGVELVYARITEAFGPGTVFKAGNALPPGTDYAPILVEEAKRCPAMLVCIGPAWLETHDAAGRRRLDQPDDWVRREISAALHANNCVIPVMLGNRNEVAVPAAASLPPDIAALSGRQACWISPGAGLDHTVSNLVRQLADAVPRLRDRLTARGAKDAVTGSSTPRSPSIEILGDENRVAGTGAHHNRFGDQNTNAGAKLPASTIPGGEHMDADASCGAPDGISVRGNANRVAGSESHGNDLGDHGSGDQSGLRSSAGHDDLERPGAASA